MKLVKLKPILLKKTSKYISKQEFQDKLKYKILKK